MAVTTTILCPNTAGKKFDLEYYLTSHMPLTENLWGPLGLKSWAVIQFKPGPDGAPPPFRLKTVTEWESEEKLKAAMTSKETSTIYSDVVNVTDEVWIGLVGETVGQSQKS